MNEPVSLNLARLRRSCTECSIQQLCLPAGMNGEDIGRLDTVARSVTLQGAPLRLTAMEYGLLAYLAHHPGRPVSKSELTEHLYAQDFDRDSNTLEVLVSRLRKKLGASVIETERGLGYRLGRG